MSFVMTVHLDGFRPIACRTYSDTFDRIRSLVVPFAHRLYDTRARVVHLKLSVNPKKRSISSVLGRIATGALLRDSITRALRRSSNSVAKMNGNREATRTSSLTAVSRAPLDGILVGLVF